MDDYPQIDDDVQYDEVVLPVEQTELTHGKSIEELEDYSFNQRDIRRVSGCSNIMEYGQLAKYNSIDAVLGAQKAVIILYTTKEDYGHWVCLTLVNRELEFFDSYAFQMDDELKYIPKYHRREMGEDTPHLTVLVRRSKYNLTQNKTQLQTFAEHINTCGRWVSARVRLRTMTLRSFIQMFSNPKIPYDALITEYTETL